jgi:hypothetical protein
VVFTVLHEFNVLALDNARLFYGLLFTARAQTRHCKSREMEE